MVKLHLDNPDLLQVNDVIHFHASGFEIKIVDIDCSDSVLPYMVGYNYKTLDDGVEYEGLWLPAIFIKSMIMNPEAEVFRYESK